MFCWSRLPPRLRPMPGRSGRPGFSFAQWRARSVPEVFNYRAAVAAVLEKIMKKFLMNVAIDAIATAGILLSLGGSLAAMLLAAHNMLPFWAACIGFFAVPVAGWRLIAFAGDLWQDARI